MPTNFYDVILLGDDLAGLIGATLCAKRGLRVLVAETPSTPLEKYPLGPYSLPRSPMPFPVESSPSVTRVIRELNFVQTLKRRLTPLKPAFQVILPDARLDVAPDPELFARELGRELGGEKEAIEAFLGRAQEISKVLEPVLGQDISVPPEGFWERRELKYSDAKLQAMSGDPLPGIPDDHAARALLAAPAAFTLPCDPRHLSPVAIARAFDMWRRGAALFQGGRDTLKQMLIEKLRTQHAGEVQRIVPGALQTKWGKAQGLALRDRDETLGVANILCGQPLAELGELLGDKPPKRVRELTRSIRPTAYRYVLHIVMEEAGVPEGIAPVAFVVADPRQPLLGDGAFAMFVGEPDDEKRVVVTLVANVPAPPEGEKIAPSLAALRAGLRRRLEDIMPFHAEHVLCVHSPNEMTPPEGLETRELPSLIPLEPLWSSELPAALGVGAVPYDIGVKNVTTASTQNLPGLGLEGDFAAGWCAARLVCTNAGKKKDYLKDEVLLGT